MRFKSSVILGSRRSSVRFEARVMLGIRRRYRLRFIPSAIPPVLLSWLGLVFVTVVGLCGVPPVRIVLEIVVLIVLSAIPVTHVLIEIRIVRPPVFVRHTPPHVLEIT